MRVRVCDGFNQRVLVVGQTKCETVHALADLVPDEDNCKVSLFGNLRRLRNQVVGRGTALVSRLYLVEHM